MRNARGVGCREGSRDLNGNLNHLMQWQLATRNPMAQGLAVDEFHRDEVQPIDFFNLVDVRDVRMRKRRRGTSLLDKTEHARLIAGEFSRQDLNRDGSV